MSSRLRLAAVFLLLAGMGLAGLQHVYIVHTNDIQGALYPATAFWLSPDFPPPLGNAASALTLIRELRQEAEANGYGFLLLDAGDVFKGTPIGDHTRGQAVVDYFNRAGYDAIGLGEDDYALGLANLKELVASSNMPWLCANLRGPGTDTLPGFIRPNLVLERGGVHFGITGLVTSYHNERIEDSVSGDLEVRLEQEVAAEQVAELRSQDVDVVVGLTHIGHRYEQRLAEEVPGFDVIIGGRSHTALYEPVETPANHTIVCQAASRLTAVGFLDLGIDTETRRIVGYEGRLMNLYAEEIPQDPEYRAHLDSLRAVAEAGYDEVLGRSERELTRADKQESPAGNLVADAMREYTGADIALHNSGGIRKDIPEGDLTYRDAYEIDGFGNTLVTGEYTGRQVKEMLELSVAGRYEILQVSGLKMSYDSERPVGSQVLSVTVAGEPLNPAGRYRVVTNSYLAGPKGQYQVFRQGEHVEDTGTPLRDAIAEYVRRHSPVDAGVEGRILLSRD